MPTVLFPDGTHYVNPSVQQLADKLSLTIRASGDFYDLTIIGGGPAGLMAAVYAAREDISTLVIDREALGGQAAITEKLDNFPAFDEGISGSELAERLGRQTRRFGAETLVAQEVEALSIQNGYKMVSTALGDEYCSMALLLSPGSTYKRLGVPGEDAFIAAGIHFCATCDGPFYAGQELLVVGGGNSGVQEAVFLTKFATKVTIVEISDELKASKILVERALSDPKIEVLTGTSVQEFKGEQRLKSVVLKDSRSGEVREVHPAGAFIFIGMVPNTGFLEGVVDLDPWGYIKTSSNMETNVEGVFAAGDARVGSTKQVAAAVGEGATAALMVRHYLDTHRSR
ncbi:MAG: NAD(P)/FAD-dependent oxidoreductase [Dehalococcoidia bacterium]